MKRLLIAFVTLLLLASVGIGALAQVGVLQASIIDVFETASPAVVHISVRGTTENALMQPVPVEGSGSGFLIDDQGHIVTNFHVVENADEITVSFDRVECCTARTIGLDASTDLAVIKVDTSDLPEPLQFADSDLLRVGQFVVAIGNPFGLEQTMTFGIISALERTIQSPDGRFVGQAIQTDATINPGNSGGPLLDFNGDVVGVNSQIISPVRGSSGVGFAIPANMVQRVAAALISDGQYSHPYVGIAGYGLSPELIQLFRRNDAELPFEDGILLTFVDSNSPAALAGLRAADSEIRVGGFDIPVGGDIILAIDGQIVRSMVDLILYLDLNRQVGDTVLLTILRDEETFETSLTLAARPDSDS